MSDKKIGQFKTKELKSLLTVLCVPSKSMRKIEMVQRASETVSCRYGIGT